MPRRNKFIFVIIFVLMTTAGQAAPSYQQSEFDKVTPWNRVTDYFATLGKDDLKKKEVLRQRKSTRKKKRIQKAREKAQKEQQERFHGLKSSYIAR